MYPEVITRLDGPIYHGNTFFQAGPWNQPLHCPNNKCHIHYARSYQPEIFSLSFH